MALELRLQLKMSQQLVMTPQLQQAIKMLQLSNMELAEYIEQELEKNPMLERDEDERRDSNHDQGPEGALEADSTGADSVSDEADSDSLESIDFDGVQQAEIVDDARDVDYENTYSDDSPADGIDAGLRSPQFADAGMGGGGFDTLAPDLEETLSERPSLRDHLNGQLSLELDDPVDRLIGLHLIDMLDEAGYISGDLQTVCDTLDCRIERVESTLAKVQQFDPPGIFARSLAECLALQLREKDRLDPCMQAFLDNLDLLGKRDLKGLAKACGTDAEDIADMTEEIKALDPKPALAFDNTITQPITPDVLMRSVEVAIRCVPCLS